MVSPKLLVFLLSAAATLLPAETLEWDTFDEFNAERWTAERAEEKRALNQKLLPTLAEYIRDKKQARRESGRALLQTPFISTIYASNGASALPASLKCSTARVGVHAYRTAGGVEYRRHQSARSACLSGVTGTDLGEDGFFGCAEAAATGNYNSFTFSEGVCTGYPIWRHRTLATCSPDPGYNGDLAEVYIATDLLIPYDAVSAYPVQIDAVTHGVGRLTLQWSNEDACSAVAKYVITSFTGTEERFGGMGVYHYDTYHASLCDDSVPDANKILTITGYDYDGAQIFQLQSTAVTTGSMRSLMSDGSCIMYDPTIALDYAQAASYCEGFSSTLPTVSSELSFDDYKQMVATVAGPVDDHFTSAIVTDLLEWQWGDRCSSPVSDTAWDAGLAPDNFTIGTCSSCSSTDEYNLLQQDCSDTQAVVCYDAPYRILDY